ncbi:hypothetical protein [Staphylococcus shinii]|uniref:hypothetical protein n=1 Tax=Staphylococcus shinii TaxID=2912228 RepID=UPI003D8025AF
MIDEKTKELQQEVINQVQNGNDDLKNALDLMRKFNDSSDKIDNKDNAFNDMNEEEQNNTIKESGNEVEKSINDFKGVAEEKANEDSNRSVGI